MIVLNKNQNLDIGANTASWTNSPTAEITIICPLNKNDILYFKKACSVANSTKDRHYIIALIFIK